MARDDSNRILQRFNEGVRAYKRALSELRREQWNEFEPSLRLCAMQTVGALEWAMKAHLRHHSRMERMASQDRDLLRHANFDVLIRLLKTYGDPPLDNGAAEAFFSFRSMRNDVEHGGVIPSIPSVEEALIGVRDALVWLTDLGEARLPTVSREVTQGPLGIDVSEPAFLKNRKGIAGRDLELHGIRRIICDTKVNNSGRLILVGGKSGSGKTHLCHEVCRIAADLGFQIAFTACEPFQEGIVLFPVKEMLRQVSGHNSVMAAIEDLYPTSSSQAAMARMLDEPGISPEQRRDAYLATFANALYGRFHLRATQRQPLLLFFDDMEWLESATADALLCIRARFREGPVIVVGAYRTDLVSSNGRDRHPIHPLLNLTQRYPDQASLVTIDGLSRSRISEAVETILGGKCEFPPSFYDHLYTETEGNPLFLREILRGLTSATQKGPEPSIRAFDGTWRITQQIGRLEIPASIEEAVMSRLNSLLDEQKRELEKAAVIGRHFAYSVIAEFSESSEDALLEFLDGLLKVDVIREIDGDDISFEFTHGKIRDVVYEHIPRFRRLRMHRDVAEVLKAIGARLGRKDYDVLIGNHLYLAGLYEEAGPYLLKAARTSTGLFSVSQAVEQFDRLLDASARTHFPEGEDEHLIRVEYAEALRQGGLYDKAISVLRTALQGANSPEAVGTIYNRLGDLYWLVGDTEQAREQYLACEAIANKEDLPALLLEVVADLCEFHDREAERLAGISPEAMAAHRTASAHYLDQQVLLAAVVGDTKAQARAHRNEAKRLRRQGNLEAALASYEAAIALVDTRQMDHSVLISYAKSLRFAGRFGEAKQIVDRVFDWGLQTGAQRTLAIAHQYRALLMMENPDHEEFERAEDELRVAIAINEEIGYARGKRESYIALGEWLIIRGSLDGGIRAFAKAMNLHPHNDCLVDAAVAQLQAMGEKARADRLRLTADISRSCDDEHAI